MGALGVHRESPLGQEHTFAFVAFELLPLEVCLRMSLQLRAKVETFTALLAAEP